MAEPGTLVPVSRELDLARAYAEIEAIRLGDRLRVHWRCDEAGIVPLVPKPQTSNNKAAGLFDKSDFVYDETDDTYRCPAGERAIHRITVVEKGQTLHKYWSSACPRCPLKPNCTTGKHRRIARWGHEDATHMAAGESSHLSLSGRYVTQSARRYPGVTLNVPVECRVLDDKNFWPTKPVTGGAPRSEPRRCAGRSLTRRIPRFSQVEIFLVVEKLVFRGRAEVVAADVEAQGQSMGGHFRHSFRWIALESHAREVLQKVVSARLAENTAPEQTSAP